MKTHQNNTAYKNFGLLPSKMAKLQGLFNIHQLRRHNDVIEAFNFKNR